MVSKNSYIFWLNCHHFCRAWEKWFSTHSKLILHLPKQIITNFWRYGCQICFCQLIFSVFSSKSKSLFLLSNEYYSHYFLKQKPSVCTKNYQDLHHFQGVWNLPHKFHLSFIIYSAERISFNLKYTFFK